MILLCCPQHKQVSSSYWQPEALMGLRMIPMDMQNPSALDSGINTSERGYCLMNKIGHSRYFLGYHELMHCFQPHLKMLDLLNTLVNCKKEGQLQGLVVLCCYHAQPVSGVTPKPRSSRAWNVENRSESALFPCPINGWISSRMKET